MCSCVYFSLVINVSCTTLWKQINVCPVCSDSRDGNTKLTARRSAHDRLTWHSGVEQTVEDVFTTIWITDGPHSTAESSLYALSATRECKPEGVFLQTPVYGFDGLQTRLPGRPVQYQWRPYRWCKWCGAPGPTTLGGPPARTR